MKSFLKRLFLVLVVFTLLSPTSLDAYANNSNTKSESGKELLKKDNKEMDIDKCIKELNKIRTDQGSWTKEQKKAQAEVFCLVVTALRADGYTDEAITGVICNMMFESRLDPYCTEGKYNYFEGYLSGDKNIEGYQGSSVAGGVGLCQWTYGRHKNFSEYCKKTGEYVTIKQNWKSSSSSGIDNTVSYVSKPGHQIAFLISENSWTHHESDVGCEKLANGLKDFKKLKDVKKATKLYCVCWEIPANRVTKAKQRAGLSEDLYELIRGSNFNSGVDKKEAQNIADTLVKNGIWSESEFVKFNNLLEGDLNFPEKDSLSKEQLKGVADWKNNIDYENEDGFIKHLRVFVVLLGIIFLVWMVLIYLCYWFDRINNFVDLDLLPKISGGRLRVSPEENECTFDPRNFVKGQVQTVNHRAIIGICIVGIFVGVLIVSGNLYRILNFIIRRVMLWLGL